jgi:energy-coupling factor transporter ATP-binding protein EcfA2
MAIERVIIKNYRALRSTDVSLNSELNIIVGDNESGKSTLLEAINLALKCQLNRRPAAYELHPFLFNVDAVAEFIASHQAGDPQAPPQILIELYFMNTDNFADLKGTNNSEQANLPGISLTICLDPGFQEEYRDYVADPAQINSVPVEYYHIVWQSFAGHQLNVRSLPMRSAMIDPSAISNTYAANKYVLEIVKDYLTKKQQVDLALSYRKMRDVFLGDGNVAAINTELADKTGEVSDKTLSVAMDTTTRASWETGVLPHLDDIPLTLVGKGEQNAIKIKLAIEAAEACAILLMEEPENHLSYANLNKLISHITRKSTDKQLIVTTHNSFVLNKLGLDHILMFNGEVAVTLSDLPAPTKEYFKKLPGHNTLRMILSTRSILVEGPSDELIVQKAYKQIHGIMPLEDGVEVIAVNSLAFKRFLDIARLLNIDARVVTDNDGDADAVRAKYADYADDVTIAICFDPDEAYKTLEPQILKANGRTELNAILGTTYADDGSLLDHMAGNKVKTALKIFDSDQNFAIPDYIRHAIE